MQTSVSSLENASFNITLRLPSQTLSVSDETGFVGLVTSWSVLEIGLFLLKNILMTIRASCNRDYSSSLKKRTVFILTVVKTIQNSSVSHETAFVAKPDNSTDKI